MKNNIEERINTPVCGDYDVIVLGGGVAGAAASLAASRCGSKVLLIEKMTVLGGLATAGHVIIYLPMCDGYGNKVISGISEELMLKSIEYSSPGLSEEWKGKPLHVKTANRYKARFNAGAFAFGIEELLKNAQVDVLLDTVFCSAIVEDSMVKAIVVENKTGREAYACRAVIDSTGDGDLFRRCGVNGTQQDNFLTYWAYHLEKGDPDLKLTRIGECDGSNLPVGCRKYYGTNVKDVTEFILMSHSLAHDRLKQNPDTFTIASFPSMPQFRTTWSLDGEYNLDDGDVNSHMEDSIGCADDWRKPGPVYEIPYRCLYTRKLKNAYAAGRNIASKNDAWEVTRVIPPAALTGQAAGTAAAMLVQMHTTNDLLNIKKLQNQLKEDDVLLHYEFYSNQ